MRRILLLISVLFVGGCVALPNAEQAQNADYGSYPNDYNEIVKSYYEEVAKDPDSLKFRNITVPRRFWIGDRFSGAKYGYLVCATVNGKNSYGAYVGYKTDGLLIRNNEVVQFIQNGYWFGKNMCE